ncbi:MAG: hypothetical protein EHM36_14400 [Deltaproteobacteria bacterium]|nr:MAG: hypothetical protein EHM36_14400 [Deltaproteobacteria bacterium]
MFKLGKLFPKLDKRTMMFSNIIREPMLPPLPDEWEFSKQYPKLDLSPRVWLNDRLGNCVYVSSLAQQRDFEVFEEGKVIEPDEKVIEQEYLKEAGGDHGLVMLNHLNVWRQHGLPFGPKRKLLCLNMGASRYKIYAYATLNPQRIREFKYATFLLGCNIGLAMPNSFMTQFAAGHPWDDTSGPPNPYNGHAVKVRGWTKDGLLLWTWGKLQLASWNWIASYTDEAYVIIDNRNDWLGDQSPIDIPMAEGYLKEITA